jgi:hypothetical protein
MAGRTKLTSRAMIARTQMTSMSVNPADRLIDDYCDVLLIAARPAAPAASPGPDEVIS